MAMTPLREEVLQVGQLEVRPAEFLALAGGQALALSMRELALLAALARRCGRIVSRDELYGAVWGGTLRPDDRSVDVYVHKLRAKLAEALPDQRFIHTHFGFGYRLSPEPSQPFHRTATPSQQAGDRALRGSDSGAHIKEQLTQ